MSELLDIYADSNGSIKRAARLYVQRQGPQYPLTQEDIYYVLHDTLADARGIARRLMGAGVSGQTKCNKDHLVYAGSQYVRCPECGSYL